MRKKVLHKNLYIVRGDRVEKGDIAIDGSRIAELQGFEPQKVIDHEFRYLAFPALFNAHTHLSMVLLRNYADGLPLMQWLEEKIWPIEARLTEEDIYAGALVAMAELIRSGCTSFRDMYDMMDEVANATEGAWLRGFIGQGMVIQSEEDMHKIEDSEALYHRCHNGKNIFVEIAPHAPYTCTDKALVRAKEVARKLGATFHIHLSESDDEVRNSLQQYKMTPTERLYRLGVLDEKTVAAHCCKMTDEDLDILARCGVSVLLNPSSNLKLGNGIAPAAKMVERGINIAIGTDGASSNNNLNMMEELHIASLAYGLAPAKMLEAASLGGARSAGLDDLGLIEPGYLADIAFLELGAAHLTPPGDMISAICYSAISTDIAHLMTAGEFVMRDRRILNFDEAEAKAHCMRCAERLFSL